MAMTMMHHGRGTMLIVIRGTLARQEWAYDFQCVVVYIIGDGFVSLTRCIVRPFCSAGITSPPPRAAPPRSSPGGSTRYRWN